MSENLNSLQDNVGEPIPALTDHAVSVSLPTWRACVGYEEGQDWVMNRMKTGYPRFFIHLSIQRLANEIIRKYATSKEKAILLPSPKAAQRCVSFIRQYGENVRLESVYVLELSTRALPAENSPNLNIVSPNIWACIFPEEQFPVAKQFWQHSGEGISSRRAEYCQSLFTAGLLLCKKNDYDANDGVCKGPRRYQKRRSTETAYSPIPSEKGMPFPESADFNSYVEERFGRNLNISLSFNAKVAIRRRIAGSMTTDVDIKQPLQVNTNGNITESNRGFSEDDVYLYPAGMNAIFNTHRTLLSVIGPHQSICYGFPYIDTLKILEKFGPGCLFYGHGSEEELDELEKRMADGQMFLALFCEFPGNPLLESPNLARIRNLADEFKFLVVIDETIGNFLNINVLPYADVLVSSLTKIFSGDSNVMGGCAILNPHGRYYTVLKSAWEEDYEDNYWAEDAIFMERNSRDFYSRVDRINRNAEAICDLLHSHPRVKKVYYPKCNHTRQFYDACRTENGGYGGLLSVTFHSAADAMKFYDLINVAKGPSLGTNFTLSSPYVVLAHYNELPWAASFGVDPDLVRFSVGLEPTKQLAETFKRALASLDPS